MTKLLAIVGPTATGKSALGLELAAELGGEIVNADALQVYRGLDIGTAKPPPEARRRIPHHLLDILEPSERFSAGEFARLARRAISGIRHRGRVPIVVGGSGLYLRALIEGLSPIPPADPDVVSALEERSRREGPERLHEELLGLDPETARRLPTTDRQRILRALSVALSSGRTLSEWQRQRPLSGPPLPSIRLGLTLPRGILYDRIARRVREMVEEGWVEEVAGLLGRHHPNVPAFQAIGYRQITRFLAADWSLPEAIESTIRETRRYAKRQLTWFQKEPGVRWVAADRAATELRPLLKDLRREVVGERLAE